ncbi:MAG: hypothetical protein K0S45_1145 [Nitrospira sp.]|jgi:hypothetical protein|nr:hypothetical protein [Nitrospira sp.]
MEPQNRPRFIVECTGSRSEDGRLVWNGRMLDLSIPGWSRTGLRGLQAGDALQLHLHIPGQTKPLSVRLATIRWASESSLGVDPILMDADDQIRLHTFVSGHGNIAQFTTDSREQIVISDAG